MKARPHTIAQCGNGSPGLTHALAPCARCLFRIGIGKKAIARLTGIPITTAYRIGKSVRKPRRRKPINITHIIRAANSYKKRQPKMPKPKLCPDLWDFKGEGKEWNGFELFEMPKTQRPIFNEEEWRDIPSCPGYKCSSMGRFKGKRHQLMKGKNHNGYIHVTISLKSGQRVHQAHRLVAQTFLANPSNLPIVNHMNAVRHDNRVNNLEWCDYRHNVRHAQKLKRESSHAHTSRNAHYQPQ